MLSSARALRIGIDASILGKQKGGVELSVEVLIRGLAAQNSQHQYYLYVGPSHPFLPGELPSNFHLLIQPSVAPWAGRLFWLPYFYRRDKLDVIYMQRVCAFWGCPRTVLHVHDAMYATHGHLFSTWKRTLLNRLFTWSGLRASAVITPTASSSADICHHYRIDPQKVSIIPDTVDTREVYVDRDPARLAAVLDKYRLKQPYVIYLGAIERNKNVHGLIEAFSHFHKLHPQFHLALVGKWRAETKGGYTEELTSRITALNLNDHIHVTGFVSSEEKRLLLNGATMLVFPSESEGLGLPPIEAMACGIPVIAGAVPSIEEFYGDALLTCPHHDTAKLAQLMDALVQDSALRQSLIEKGLRRAKRDSWDYKIPLMLNIFTKTAS